MRIHFDCIPCLLRQTIDVVRLVTDDEDIHERVLHEVLLDLNRADLQLSPPAMAQRIHRVIRRLTGMEDAYRSIKERSNEFALSIYPGMKEIVEKSDNPFETAVRLSIAGNIIDFGVHGALLELDESLIHGSIQYALNTHIDGGAVNALQNSIVNSKRILYLADNAGEIVFDRLLIEKMPMDRVIVAVRGHPIINDATMEDAEVAGLTDLVKVISNGSDAPGTLLDDCSEEFRNIFDSADIVLSKGQGNYETLSGVNKNVVFLLKVKCPVIAQDIGVDMGSIIISSNHDRKSK